MTNFSCGENHDHSTESEYWSLRAKAIENLLVEKGVCKPEEVSEMADKIDSRSPKDGAKVVAHAWVDSDYKARLIADPEAALLELGYDLPETAPKLAVMENSQTTHYVAVCTLCSCYPRAILGRPPDWYKGTAYRSRLVVDPRSVLREFGLNLTHEVELRVVDSSADLRYLILPERPQGTEEMSEDELATLVTQESMIGVTKALSPNQRLEIK